jgi:hypothetical protein
MSSATPGSVYDTRQNLRGMAAPMFDGQGEASNAPTMRLNPRQLELDWCWRFYRASEYEGRAVDWNGTSALPKHELDAIATSGAIPPGFVDAGGQTCPLVARRPTAPAHTARVVVDRFTSLVFGTTRQPRITADDADTSGWINAFAEAVSLFACMQQARTYGGGMGSVAITFGFVDGHPRVDVHDARWVTPTFRDRAALDLATLEKRYEWVDYEPDGEGGWREVWYWYRRVIDTATDTVWPKVPVIAGVEPEWERFESIVAAHNFGFVPGVWIQNLQVDDSIDGDPDCHGAYDTISAYDRMLAQADRAGIANCDPTPVIKTDEDVPDMKLGSSSALVLPVGGDAKYLEISGHGVDAAIKLLDRYEQQIVRITRCVIDSQSSARRGYKQTATEIDRNYSAMLDQADILREQYGNRGMRKLLELVLKAARLLEAPKLDVATGEVVRSKVKLPPRVVENPDGTTTFAEYQLGRGQHVALVWPQYFAPTIEEAGKAVENAVKAYQGGVIDLATAVASIAQHFGIEDIPAMVARLQEVADAKARAAVAGLGMPPGAMSGNRPGR